MMCRQNSTWIIKLCQGWVGKVLNNSKAKSILIWYNLGDGNTSHQLTKWYYYGYIWYDELRNNYIMTVFFLWSIFTYLYYTNQNSDLLTKNKTAWFIEYLGTFLFILFVKYVGIRCRDFVCKKLCRIYCAAVIKYAQSGVFHVSLITNNCITWRT